MIKVLFNLICAVAFALVGLLMRMDAVATAAADAEALRIAQDRALDDEAAAKQSEIQKQVEELAARYKHAKGTGGPVEKVKMPDLIEIKRPGVVTFAELEPMPKSVNAKGAEIPAKFRDLDGKTLTLTGFQLVPFADDNITEVIVAKNPWDECCLGTPPTLRTSVQVRLKAGTILKKSPIRIASFTGSFHVRPNYVTDGDKTFLNELYVMEDAVEAQRTAGAAEAYVGHRSVQTYYLAALPLLVVAAVGGNFLLLRRRDDEIQFSDRKFSI